MNRDKKTIEVMIKMYCSVHQAPREGLCRECGELLDYARQRLERCPFGKDKPACVKCARHCYSPPMRAKVIAVMKYAGERMLLRHPGLALLHLARGKFFRS